MPYLSVSMIDSMGRTTKRTYEMDTQATLADYITAATSFVGALEDVTDLGAIRVDLVITALVEGFDVTEGANVDVGATFSGLIEGGNGKRASMKVPAIKASLVNADASVPITGVVAAFLGEFEDGEDFKLSDGEQISSWLKGTLDR